MTGGSPFPATPQVRSRCADPATVRRHLLTGLLVALLGALVGGVVPLATAAPAGATDAVYRPLRFPVEGASRLRTRLRGSSENGGRSPPGQRPVRRPSSPLPVAATDAVVTSVDVERGNAGNMVVLRDAAGWEYRYLHLNNDTPGTDDGANLEGFTFAPGITPGAVVQAGQHIGYVGDSGNAERTPPHLHFELRPPGRRRRRPVPVAPAQPGSCASATGARPTPTPTAPPATEAGRGYWTMAADGGIFSFGEARFFGSMGGQRLNPGRCGASPPPLRVTGTGWWRRTEGSSPSVTPASTVRPVRWR